MFQAGLLLIFRRY